MTPGSLPNSAFHIKAEGHQITLLRSLVSRLTLLTPEIAVGILSHLTIGPIVGLFFFYLFQYNRGRLCFDIHLVLER